MNIETPLERYQRLPPKQRLGRSVIGFVVLTPSTAWGLWYVGLPVALVVVLTAMVAILGAVQTLAAYRQWRSQGMPAASSTEPVPFRIPMPLLILEGVGFILLSVGGAEYFAGLEVLPEEARFDGYGLALLIVGSAAVLPAMATAVRLAILRTRE